MHNQLIQECVIKSRATVEALSLEVLKSTIYPKDALGKVKQARADMTHLYNLLKIEEDLSRQRTEDS